MACSAGRSCVTRARQPSWRGPTVEPWSSPLCSASPRWSTSWAWVNSSSASCLKKTTKKAPPLCLFALSPPLLPTMHHTEDSHLIPKRNPRRWVRRAADRCILFRTRSVECRGGWGGSLSFAKRHVGGRHRFQHTGTEATEYHSYFISFLIVTVRFLCSELLQLCTLGSTCFKYLLALQSPENRNFLNALC